MEQMQWPVVVSNPWVLHNQVDAVLISLLREVMCTVPGQGEGAGQQGRIKVVSGALTGLWGMMDLGFIVALLQRQDNVKICIKFPHTIKRQCIKTLICKLLEGN